MLRSKNVELFCLIRHKKNFVGMLFSSVEERRLLFFDCEKTSIPVCPDDCSLVSVAADNTGAIRVPSAHHHG